MTGTGRLREQVSARVFASPVDLRTVDVDGLVAALAAAEGPDADVEAIDEGTWSKLLDDHDSVVQGRRAARAAALDHPQENP
ncbi:hypothetical protein [Actinomycetospora soli]|uniref:hypothetical protein n=1 Tax=Actinomycetospora soli TaxID=2893887 RepID=UPI001E36B029|nr:hypothetical protein [Actinomycetospora soli]MCD2191344.1 hypothetical protein [Actinomycetospora soli]